MRLILAGETPHRGKMRTAPEGGGTPLQGLTRSSDLTREGLGMKPTRVCSIPECSRPFYARGWCDKHYARWFRHGDPTKILNTDRTTSVMDRLMAKIERNPRSGCWEWTAGRFSTGYGALKVGGQNRQAHRVMFAEHHGEPIPAGKEVDHVCHNPPCINPAHLRLVTSKQNKENRSGPCVRSTSGITGVTRYKGSKWRVSVTHDGVRYEGGYFTDVHEAGAVARDLRNRLFTHNDIDRREAS